MNRNLLGLFAAAALQSGGQPASRADADARSLFHGLQGDWICAGAFANGSPLNASLHFIPTLGGKALRFVHSDLPPTNYQAESLWAVDKSTGQLVSLSWTGSSANAGESAAVYASDMLTPASVILSQRPLFTPPFAPNRFRWAITSETLEMQWEVKRQNGWTEGDHLHCTRPRK